MQYYNLSPVIVKHEFHYILDSQRKVIPLFLICQFLIKHESCNISVSQGKLQFNWFCNYWLEIKSKFDDSTGRLTTRKAESDNWNMFILVCWQLWFLHSKRGVLAYRRPPLTTDIASEIAQFQLWIVNLHIRSSVGTDTRCSWIDNLIWNGASIREDLTIAYNAPRISEAILWKSNFTIA